MISEHLVYHSPERGYASYGRDGGQGRDIIIAPSIDPKADKKLIHEISKPETSVVGVLDLQPQPFMEQALQSLMPVWNEARRGNVYIAYEAPDAAAFCRAFTDAALRDFKRQGLAIDKIDLHTLDSLQQDLSQSVELMREVIRPDQALSFRMVYYPPASQPLRLFHDWHADSYPPSLMGKVRLQRSLNHDGIRFAFKEQAAPERALAGVGMSVGRAVFKITPENIHSAPPVSPVIGRAMYTITGTPRFDI